MPRSRGHGGGGGSGGVGGVGVVTGESASRDRLPLDESGEFAINWGVEPLCGDESVRGVISSSSSLPPSGVGRGAIPLP